MDRWSLFDITFICGYKVYGTERIEKKLETEETKLFNDIDLIDFEITEFSNVQKVIKLLKPDEVYNLVAQSFVGLSFDVPILTSDITAMGCLRMLSQLEIQS